MNKIEFIRQVKSITKPAIEMAARLYGTHPINDTIDELIHPTGVSYNDAYLCQCAIDSGIDEDFLKEHIKQ